MHNLSLHFARMGSRRRESLEEDLEIRLRASLPSSRTLCPSGCRRSPGVRKPRARGVSQLVFTSRLCQTFAIPTIVLIPSPLTPYHSATRVPLFILLVASRWFTDFQSVETGPFKFNGVTGIFPPSVSSVNKLNLHI